jgi:hypothetical protein
MPTWRETILAQFPPHAFPLTVVADPDRLLSDGALSAALEAEGFDLLPFDDHVAFRQMYESAYRSRWDRGESTERSAIVISVGSKLDRLPFDVLQAGHAVRISLAELFPDLSYPIVALLDRIDLDAFWEARAPSRGDVLGDTGTRDFILRYVYKLSPDATTEPADLLSLLIGWHVRGRNMPAPFAERLIEVLARGGRFAEWPLPDLVRDHGAFFRFLQERWPRFLDGKVAELTGTVCEPPSPYGLEVPGPVLLPFDGIRSHVDTLFLDRILTPVEHKASNVLEGDWVRIGVRPKRR